MRHTISELCDGLLGLNSKRIGKYRSVGGFTLIEVLVALLVLTIGLVALAALNLTSMKSAHSSYYRSIASSVALDFEERMWQFGAETLNTPGQCLIEDNIDDVRDELIDQWGLAPGVSGEIGIPNLVATVGAPEPGTRTRAASGVGSWTDRWVDITLTLTWTESRFQNEGALTERFDYAVRMPCVSQFTPPPSP